MTLRCGHRYRSVGAEGTVLSTICPLRSPQWSDAKAEIEEVVSLLADSDTRLVTVTGAGGIGKTRFALAVAQRAESSLLDGVCWVDLADVSDAATRLDGDRRRVGRR